MAVFPEFIQIDAVIVYCADCCSQRNKVIFMFSVLLHGTFTVQILHVLYSVQLNCTYSNYTEAAATCSAAQQHSTFTVQILYKLYSLQLNCTHSNYTEAQHIYCTNTVQTVQSATELYLQ